MTQVNLTGAGYRGTGDCPQDPICTRLTEVKALLPVKSACQATGCKILAKAEYMNPGGSVKDRIARFIVTQAERRGELKPGGTILEVTSGNTGIALSMVGAIKGYKVVVVMPASVSEERRSMIQAFGAELRLIERLTGIQAAVEEAEQKAAEDPKIFLPRQFSNPDNALCHQQTTGAEILAQVSGPIDAFVTGVGTGGTLMGVARALSRAGQAFGPGRRTSSRDICRSQFSGHGESGGANGSWSYPGYNPTRSRGAIFEHD